MGWWGVAWRISVLVGCFAAFVTLPAFRSYCDTVVSFLTGSPRRWFNEDNQSAELHSVVRTSIDAVFSWEALTMYDGSDYNKGIYLAVLGSVYDVSSGRRHYGPDGSYGFFSGLFSYIFLTFRLEYRIICTKNRNETYQEYRFQLFHYSLCRDPCN